MKKLLPFIGCLFLLFGFFTACDSDDSSEDFDNGTAYVPLTEGSWYEYKLDSTLFDDFDNSVVQKEWDLRVEIGEQITDGEGDQLIKINRYQRPRNSSEEYSLDRVWFAKIVNGRLETFEDNLHFIKLVFPVTEGKTWEGNQFISPQGNDNPNTSTQFYEDWEYEYVSVGEAFTVQGMNFSDVMQVNQTDQFGGPGAINHFISNEWYAHNVGLIKKRMEIVVENCGAENCSEKEKPVLERTQLRKGFILDMELTDYLIAD